MRLGRIIFSALAAGSLGFGVPPANALSVTVGDFKYNVLWELGRFESLETILTDTTLSPWFADPALAESFANNFYATVGNDWPVAEVAFSFYSQEVYAASEDLGVYYDTKLLSEFSYYAYTDGSPIPVPEVNGPTMAKLALILFAAYLGLSAMRASRRPDPA